MADRPILFTGPMVRALDELRKTQTRRVLDLACDEPPAIVREGMVISFDENGVPRQWPRTPAVGDRLWVREAFSGPHGCRNLPPRDWPVGCPIWRWAEGDPAEGDWTKPKPSMFMPRWASRLTLLVTEVRVQRLHDINEADAIAEGIEEQNVIISVDGSTGHHRETTADRYWHGFEDEDFEGHESAEEAYAELWDELNAKRGYGWEDNPWIVATTFEVYRGNIKTAHRHATAHVDNVT